MTGPKIMAALVQPPVVDLTAGRPLKSHASARVLPSSAVSGKLAISHYKSRSRINRRALLVAKGRWKSREKTVVLDDSKEEEEEEVRMQVGWETGIL